MSSRVPRIQPPSILDIVSVVIEYTIKTRLLQPLLYPTHRPLLLVGLGRIELPTSRLSGVRSNHLSYRPCGPPNSALRQLNPVY